MEKPNRYFKPIIVCNSIGGVASTTIFDLINEKFPYSSPNRFSPGTMHWKHSLYPPQFSFISKGIFIIGNPELAILSIFRRKLDVIHGKNKGLPVSKFTISEYIDNGCDVYRTLEHMKNWNECETQYPILRVKQESMFENRETILSFLEIDEDPDKVFPKKKKRRSSLSMIEDLGQGYLGKFQSILSPATEYFNSLPNIEIR